MSKKRDLDVNRMLVAEVQKRPVLYDVALAPTRTKEDILGAWVKVVSVVDEPGFTVEVCKDKWKHFRTAFVKDLQKSRRSYYLKDDMNFLMPYVRSNKCKALVWGDDLNTSEKNAAGTPQGNAVGTSQSNDQQIVETNPDIKSMSVKTLSPKAEPIRPLASIRPLATRNFVQSPSKVRLASGKHTPEKGSTSRQTSPRTNFDLTSQNTARNGSNRVDGIKHVEEDYPSPGVSGSPGTNLPGPSHYRMANRANADNGKISSGSVTPSAGIKRKKKSIRSTSTPKKRMVLGVDSRKSYMLSLLPDIQQMSDKQWRSFRSEVSTQIASIMDYEECD